MNQKIDARIAPRASLEHLKHQAKTLLKRAGVTVGDSPHCLVKNWQGRDVWLAFFSDPSGNQLAFKVDAPAQP